MSWIKEIMWMIIWVVLFVTIWALFTSPTFFSDIKYSVLKIFNPNPVDVFQNPGNYLNKSLSLNNVFFFPIQQGKIFTFDKAGNMVGMDYTTTLNSNCLVYGSMLMDVKGDIYLGGSKYLLHITDIKCRGLN